MMMMTGGDMAARRASLGQRKLSLTGRTPAGRRNSSADNGGGDDGSGSDAEADTDADIVVPPKSARTSRTGSINMPAGDVPSAESARNSINFGPAAPPNGGMYQAMNPYGMMAPQPMMYAMGMNPMQQQMAMMQQQQQQQQQMMGSTMGNAMGSAMAGMMQGLMQGMQNMMVPGQVPNPTNFAMNPLNMNNNIHNNLVAGYMDEAPARETNFNGFDDGGETTYDLATVSGGAPKPAADELPKDYLQTDIHDEPASATTVVTPVAAAATAAAAHADE
jgi:hypothetical protein